MSMILGFLLSWAPTIVAGSGPLALIAGIAAKFMPSFRTYLVLGAIAAGVIAVGAATAHYLHLRSQAAELAELQPKVAGLEQSFGCPSRPAAERDLFACIPARDRDIEAARADEKRKQQEAANAAQADLQQKADALQKELDAAEDAIQDSTAADDGPVPQVMKKAWARERAKRGKK